MAWTNRSKVTDRWNDRYPESNAIFNEDSLTFNHAFYTFNGVQQEEEWTDRTKQTDIWSDR